MMATVSTETLSAGNWGRMELRRLYDEQRWPMVRLATLLLNDPAGAEEVVQDAFIQAYLAWDRLRDPARGVAYLRSAVLNGARTRLRHRKVVERYEPDPPGRSRLVATPEGLTEAAEDRRRVMAALRTLPTRQRECLVLRYYLDLSEAEIAAALGISAGSVKTHTHRGLAALSTRLEDR